MPDTERREDSRNDIGIIVSTSSRNQEYHHFLSPEVGARI